MNLNESDIRHAVTDALLNGCNVVDTRFVFVFVFLFFFVFFCFFFLFLVLFLFLFVCVTSFFLLFVVY